MHHQQDFPRTMNNTRLFLYLSLGLVLLLLWQNWLVWQRPQTPSSTQTTPSQSQTPLSQAPFSQEDIPETGTLGTTPQPDQPQHQAVTPHQASAGIVVETDLLRVEIATRGGSIRRLDLLQLPVALETPDVPYRLMDSFGDTIYVMQSGLLHDRIAHIDADLSVRAPSHHADYQATRNHYKMPQTEDVLRIPLVWREQDIEVEKAFIFRRGSYLVDIEYRIRNGGSSNWVGRQYSQLRRSQQAESDSANMFIYTFFGASYYDGKYNKLEFEDIAAQAWSQTIAGGWVAMVEHYFTSALLAHGEEANDYYTKQVAGR